MGSAVVGDYLGSKIVDDVAKYLSGHCRKPDNTKKEHF